MESLGEQLCDECWYGVVRRMKELLSHATIEDVNWSNEVRTPPIIFK